MKISASVLARENTENASALFQHLKYAGADYLHIDCNHQQKIEQLLSGWQKNKDLPIDIHIISHNPEHFFTEIEQFGITDVTLQFENLSKNFAWPKLKGVKLGLALVSETPIHVFEKWEKLPDFVLLMTTTPGKSGGRFNKSNFKKIRQFAKQYPGIPIHVDGGVNAEVAFILRNLGVAVAVSGSYLLNDASFGVAVSRLKHQSVASDFVASDFMIDFKDLPVLNPKKCSFADVLQAIENFKLGFTLFTDENHKFCGLASNADVRKALLNNIGKFDNIVVADVINTSPKLVAPEQTVTEILEMIQQSPLLLNFLPVVNTKGVLEGAITFNQLIRSEL